MPSTAAGGKVLKASGYIDPHSRAARGIWWHEEAAPGSRDAERRPAARRHRHPVQAAASRANLPVINRDERPVLGRRPSANGQTVTGSTVGSIAEAPLWDPVP